MKTFQWKGAHYYCNSIIITDILLHRCFVCHITTGRMSYRQQVSSSIFIKLGKYVFLGFKPNPLDALLICKRFMRQLIIFAQIGWHEYFSLHCLNSIEVDNKSLPAFRDLSVFLYFGACAWILIRLTRRRATPHCVLQAARI